MALTDARAIFPDLKTCIGAPERDQVFLAALHRWAGRFSPFVAMDGRDGLFIDITGCAHLFGGEQAMLEMMTGDFAGLRIKAQGAIADAKGAAFALARQGTRHVIAPPGQSREALCDLPLAFLRLDRETVSGLNRLGFSTIGALYTVPRASLARRFGMELVTRLDQALGFSSEPVAPTNPVPHFAARMTLPDPIGLLDDVTEALRRLIAQLCHRLEDAGRGMRSVRLTVRRADNTHEAIEVGLARPSREPDAILRLFARPLSELDAGFGIDFLRLEARGVEPVCPRQLSGEPSVKSETAQSAALDELIARLGNRIGFNQVRRFVPAQSHIPERSFVTAAAVRARLKNSEWSPGGPRRPLTLMTPEPVQPVLPGRPPRTFSWRGRKIDIAHAVGPERIAPEWWRKNPDWAGKPKDYWRVEGAGGERLWLVEDHEAHRWTVCGEFP